MIVVFFFLINYESYLKSNFLGHVHVQLTRFISKCVELQSFFRLTIEDYLRFFCIIVLAPCAVALAFLAYQDFGFLFCFP